MSQKSAVFSRKSSQNEKLFLQFESSVVRPGLDDQNLGTGFHETGISTPKATCSCLGENIGTS